MGVHQEGLKARLAVVAKRVLPRELLGVPGADGNAVEETEAARNEWVNVDDFIGKSHVIPMKINETPMKIIFVRGKIGGRDTYLHI